jgi:TolB-like protein/Tfp pilus assembly protein PilF
MFTDMVGYSALTERNERLALQLLEEHRQLIRPLLTIHSGREIKTMADGFLIEFSSAVEAVRCAMAIQRVLHSRNCSSPEEEQIMVRIGIHLGDNLVQNGDVLGNAVNVASRIEQVAEPGGICLSEDVERQVQGRVKASFVSIGKPELKNIGTAIEVFKVVGETRPVSDVSTNGIAVLPFVNMSADPENEYFSDGLTEDILTQISRVGSLKVISRTSAMAYKGTTKNLRAIGRELGVASILEGSVRKAGERVRITAQLIDAKSDAHLWAETYDRELKDIFAVQSEVAESIVAALKAHITPAEKERIQKKPTLDLEAYQLYLKGRSLLNSRTNDGLLQAISAFEKAVERDPEFGAALAGIADSYTVLAILEFMRPHDAFPKARKAAEAALKVNPTLAEAHASLGLILFQYEWDFKNAERELLLALEANPNYAPGHHFFADYLKGMGRFDEALSQIREAQALDPLSLAISSGVGHVLYLSRQYEPAIVAYRHTLDLNPNFVQARLWFGRPYLQMGRFEEAIAELKQAVDLSHGSTISIAVLAHAYASAGRKDEALAILAELENRGKTTYVSSYWIAMVEVGLADVGSALDHFEKAYEEHSAWLAWANVEPRFDSVRGEARFKEVLRKIGFAL